MRVPVITELMWRYRHLRKTDKVVIALLLAGLALNFAFPTAGVSILARLLVYILLIWFGVRLLRFGIRRAIWRLRNRLLVVYAFIAVVPIVLIVTLTGMLAWLVIGQIAVYLVTSELERNTSTLHATFEWPARLAPRDRPLWIEGAWPVLANRFPGLEALIRDSKKGAEWKFPPSASITTPDESWGDASGLVLRDGFLYGWTRIVGEGSSVTAAFPLTSQFLAALAPNLGEVGFLPFRGDSANPASNRPVRLLPATSARSGGIVANRIPVAANRYDRQIVGWGLIPVYVWNAPGKMENELVRVRTRPSAVFAIIFAQKVDFAQDYLPLAMLTGALLFLMAEAISFVIGISITRTITAAVHHLYESTERVMEGDFSHRIEVKGSDQLATLSSSFNRMTENLERLLVVAKEKERLQAEIEIAREVQNQLYPRAIPALRTLAVSAYCNPARMVSGDYYDYQCMDENLLTLAIGDVAGKGISAALLMATVQSAMRSQVRSCMELAAQAGGGSLASHVSTSRLVSNLNQHLYAHTSPEKFATFYFGVYDDNTGMLTYTNAGHLPPILLRNGSHQLLEVNGMVVGAFPFSQYGESRIQLEQGDLLLFYTDGITEPENEYGEMFGEDRLIQMVTKNRALTSDEIVKIVFDAVRDWTGSPELPDDQTIVLARRD